MASNSMEVYVHIGMHKSGSSFLQESFFINYINEILFFDVYFQRALKDVQEN